jgi:hypothetical protein
MDGHMDKSKSKREERERERYPSFPILTPGSFNFFFFSLQKDIKDTPYHIYIIYLFVT